MRGTELPKLASYVENNQPIPWVPVAQVPDFVHFMHRPHIAAGLNCETCHGDVSKMTVYENPQLMNMGWCLKCHRETRQGQSRAADEAHGLQHLPLLDMSICLRRSRGGYRRTLNGSKGTPMSKSISRRDFLKLAGAGAATTCGADRMRAGVALRYSASRTRRCRSTPTTGRAPTYATTCRECSAGCGLVVRTMQGRAIKVEGNKNNPVNLGKTCARGQVTLQGLYNPDRIQNPGKHTRGANTWSSSRRWRVSGGHMAGCRQRRVRVPSATTSRTRSRSCWAWRRITCLIW